MKPSRLILFFLSISLVVGCSDGGVSELANYDQTDTTEISVPPSTEVESSDAMLLSAFFGADNVFPQFADRFVCKGAAGSDGMPVVFSREVDTTTLQAGDFQITRADGSKGRLVCVTPAPAADTGEVRTILLIGEFGSPENQPVQVEIVGNLLSIDMGLMTSAVITCRLRLWRRAPLWYTQRSYPRVNGNWANREPRA